MSRKQKNIPPSHTDGILHMCVFFEFVFVKTRRECRAETDKREKCWLKQTTQTELTSLPKVKEMDKENNKWCQKCALCRRKSSSVLSSPLQIHRNARHVIWSALDPQQCNVGIAGSYCLVHKKQAHYTHVCIQKAIFFLPFHKKPRS